MRIHFTYHQIRLGVYFLFYFIFWEKKVLENLIVWLSTCCLSNISWVVYQHYLLFCCAQIRALQKKKKAGKYAKKVKAKTRRKMHELSNPLEPNEFADMWKE